MATSTGSFPITGYSAVNGLGMTTDGVLARLFAGERGLIPCPDFYGVESWCGQVAAELPELPPTLQAYESRQARLCALALAELVPQVKHAVARWGAKRVAIVIGTSTGGIAQSEEVVAAAIGGHPISPSYHVVRQHALDATVPLCRLMTGAMGPGYVVSTACSSSAKVFASALRLLRAGHADAVLAGGVDTLCRLTLRGFASLEVLAKVPCRPFAKDRQGINIGEGGAFALIEREGAAKVGLFGAGETSDAHHMTAPHPDGDGAYRAMALALHDASLELSAIDHVNAHGTASQQNDLAESKAIVRLFGQGMRVVATKGATGHLLGAAGASEIVFSLAALVRGLCPPSVGSDPIDESLQVDVSARTQPLRRDYALSNSLAFGGSNAAVVVGRWP